MYYALQGKHRTFTSFHYNCYTVHCQNAKTHYYYNTASVMIELDSIVDWLRCDARTSRNESWHYRFSTPCVERKDLMPETNGVLHSIFLVHTIKPESCEDKKEIKRGPWQNPQELTVGFNLILKSRTEHNVLLLPGSFWKSLQFGDGGYLL